jgi:hemoglobin-like flavoprotein
MADVVEALSAAVSEPERESWKDEQLSFCVKRSFLKWCYRRDEFYDAFYTRLFKYSPESRVFFEHLNMHMQHSKLDGAVERLINFGNDVDNPALLHVKTHHQGLGLSAEHYDDFAAAFISTLKLMGEDDEDALSAWMRLFCRTNSFMNKHGKRVT